MGWLGWAGQWEIAKAADRLGGIGWNGLGEWKQWGKIGLRNIEVVDLLRSVM